MLVFIKKLHNITKAYQQRSLFLIPRSINYMPKQNQSSRQFQTQTLTKIKMQRLESIFIVFIFKKSVHKLHFISSMLLKNIVLPTNRVSFFRVFARWTNNLIGITW